MDIKGAENKLDHADTFLTKLKNILKKHWGIILIVLGVYFVYWALTSEPEEEVQTEEVAAPYVIDQYLEIQTNGDTLLIQVWSDGIETIAED